MDLDSLGIDLVPKPFSSAPSWACTRRHLRTYDLGRTSRWEEVGLESPQLLKHSLRLVADLAGCGWKSQDFRNLLYTVRGRRQTDALKMLTAAVAAMLELL